MMQDDQIPKRAHDQPLQSHHPEHCAVKIDSRNLLLFRALAMTRPTTVLAGGAEKRQGTPRQRYTSLGTAAFRRAVTLRLAIGNGSNGARLWENAWDEAADALCFPRDSWMPGRSTDACGLNEAIRSRSPPSAVPHRRSLSFASGYRPERGGSSQFGPCRGSGSGSG